MIIMTVIVAYVFSVVIGWIGGRYMAIESRKAGEEPLPWFVAILFTFVPVLNAMLGAIAFITFLTNKFKSFDSRKFYRLD